jgi:hypothetical protein
MSMRPEPNRNDGDVYDELLRDTRGMHREQVQARELWLSNLDVERKVEHLFELEILLKGMACFASSRNHAGPPKKTPVVAQDFRPHAAVVREALGRVVQTCRVLLADREKAFVFQRYLETVLPDERVRTRLLGDRFDRESPEQSLFVLRHAMSHVLEVTAGLARLPRVSFRLFYSLLALASREIAQNTFFNPLAALEFRPEFDRIANTRMLDVVRAVPGEPARRLVALTFLSLFRMLRYLAWIETTANERSDFPRRSLGMVYMAVSVLRSDARALSGYVRRRAGPVLADAFEVEVFQALSDDLDVAFGPLLGRSRELAELKATLEGIASNVRLEVRRTFERDFPPLEASPSPVVLALAVRRCAESLRPSLQGGIMFLASSLGAGLDLHTVFDDPSARRALSERLRRDVWMFAQIARAFAQKARSVPRSRVDAWGSGGSPHAFVHEFSEYFRGLGYPLLQAAAYPRVEAFAAAMRRLRRAEIGDEAAFDRAVAEAEYFAAFSTELLVTIGEREELLGAAFDRRAAAESLKLYLGDESSGLGRAVG